jgi:hypothetical protein
MITDHQVQRKGDEIILGLAVRNAAMDIVTTTQLLSNCLRLLTEPHQGLVYATMGKFGSFPVTLNVDHDNTVSIFIDGPDFDEGRVQSSAIWPDKESLYRIIKTILETGQQPAGGDSQ